MQSSTPLNLNFTQLFQVTSAKPDGWPDLRFLCQDDLSPMATDAAVETTLSSHSTGRCSGQSRDCSPSLLAWWDGHMSAVDGALGLDTMRTIVGRYDRECLMKSYFTASSSSSLLVILGSKTTHELSSA